MTLDTSNSRVQYQGNGVTVEWPVDFKFYLSSDLVVLVSDDDGSNAETLVESTDYTVTGGSGSTGSVTYPISGSPMPEGRSITISRSIAITQPTGFENMDLIDLSLIERTFDRGRMIDQQLQEQLDRCVKAPVTSPDALTFEDIEGQAAAAAASASAASTSAGQAGTARDAAVVAQGLAEDAQAAAEAAAASVPADALRPGDIGSIVQAYDAAIVKADETKDFTAGYTMTPVQLTDAAPPTGPGSAVFTVALGHFFYWTLGADRTLPAGIIPSGKCAPVCILVSGEHALGISASDYDLEGDADPATGTRRCWVWRDGAETKPRVKFKARA